MQKKLFAAVLASGLGLAGSASAADVYSGGGMKDVPYVPVFTWTGFYIGANVGGAITQDALYNAYGTGFANGGTFAIPLGNGTTTGVVGGGQLGYNYQVGRFVFGIEGEIQANGTNSHFVTHPFGQQQDWKAQGDYIATVAARLGFVIHQDTLVYIKGGGAWDQTKYNVSTSEPFAYGSNPGISVSRSGYVLGFGAEYAITPNWTVKLEYEYMDFGSQHLNFGLGSGTNIDEYLPFTTEAEHTLNVVKFGVNYKFGGCCDAPLK
jgi:outer membrane immunogenic protein